MQISANQVTLSRLLLMPVVGALFYQGATARWVALIGGGIVGLTDVLDGYLARRQGPTILGGLMDPIADKVFVAICFLLFADLGWISSWAVIAVFLREFLVTALRSGFEARKRALAPSLLARFKTWVQMFACGYALLFSLHPSRRLVAGSLAMGAVGALLGATGARLLRRRSWAMAWVFSGCFAIETLVYWFLGPVQFLSLLVLTAVVVTWASGLDYLLIGARVFARDRTLPAFDVVRLAGAAALPVLAVLSLRIAHPHPGLVVAIVAIELSHGGLDNLLAHHRAAATAWQWGGRILVVSLLLAASLAQPGRADFWATGALAASLAGGVAGFWNNRRYYLEARLRDKRRPAAQPSAHALPGRV